MAYKFKKIGIIGRASRHAASAGPNISNTLDSVCGFLATHKLSALIDAETAGLMTNPKFPVVSRTQIGEECDLAIVVGGDGSILSAARTLADYNISVIGIHRGRLGFLTDIAPDNISANLIKILTGEYVRHELCLLHANIINNGKIKTTIDAINEIVVNSGSVTKMIEFEVYIDEQFVYSQRSDGLIITTPTGSTAYSLSAGGPILTPDIKALLLVPMFPHNLTSRPVVITDKSKIRIVPLTESLNQSLNQSLHPGVSGDGQAVESLTENDTVEIYKSNKILHLLHPSDYNYYETLRTKLHWGTKPGYAE